MEERRRSIRQKCRLRGRIYFYDGRKSVPCGIRDISYEGARIELLEPIDIPEAIDLYIPQKHRTAAKEGELLLRREAQNSPADESDAETGN